MRADVLSKSPSVAQGVRVNSPAPSEDQSVFVHELQKHGTEAQPLKTFPASFSAKLLGCENVLKIFRFSLPQN